MKRLGKAKRAAMLRRRVLAVRRAQWRERVRFAGCPAGPLQRAGAPL